MTDPEMSAQLRAEEMAYEEWDTDYFRLPHHARHVLYQKAERELAEKRLGAADQRRKAIAEDELGAAILERRKAEGKL